jgi:hypothetical protein
MKILRVCKTKLKLFTVHKQKNQAIPEDRFAFTLPDFNGENFPRRILKKLIAVIKMPGWQ